GGGGDLFQAARGDRRAEQVQVREVLEPIAEVGHHVQRPIADVGRGEAQRLQLGERLQYLDARVVDLRSGQVQRLQTGQWPQLDQPGTRQGSAGQVEVLKLRHLGQAGNVIIVDAGPPQFQVRQPTEAR